MKKYLIFPTIMLLLSCNATLADDPNWDMVSAKDKAICDNVQNVRIPGDDQPSDQELEESKGCNAEALYFGIDNQQQDYEQARTCAFATNNYGILSMVYANATGAARNWDLAIHFACLMGGAPQEIEGRIEHLTQLKDANSDDPKFDICDDATSKLMLGLCTARFKKQDAAKN